MAAAISLCAVGPTLATEAHEGYVIVPGAHLWYHDTGGSGEAIILLHAGFGHAELFERYQIPAFATAGYRVIAYDRRGYGRSVNDVAGQQVATAVDDLQALAEQLGLHRFHLVATAGGGIVALDYVLSYPNRVRSLVVANSIGAPDASEASDSEMIRRLRPPGFDQLPTWFKELGPEYRAANAQGMQQWIEIQSRTHTVGPLTPAQPLRNNITLAALAGINIPTFVLTGDADLYSPPTATKRFARRLPDAQFASLPQAGHSAYWEQPEAFDRLVLGFIGKH